MEQDRRKAASSAYVPNPRAAGDRAPQYRWPGPARHRAHGAVGPVPLRLPPRGGDGGPLGGELPRAPGEIPGPPGRAPGPGPDDPWPVGREGPRSADRPDAPGAPPHRAHAHRKGRRPRTAGGVPDRRPRDPAYLPWPRLLRLLLAGDDAPLPPHRALDGEVHRPAPDSERDGSRGSPAAARRPQRPAPDSASGDQS